MQACTLHIAVGSPPRDGCVQVPFCNPWLFASFSRSRSCQSSLALARAPVSATSSAVRVLAAPETVQRLFGSVLRTSLNQHQPTTHNEVVSSVVSRVRWDKEAMCIVVSPPHASRTGHHRLQACLSPDQPRCRHLCHDLGCLASTVRSVLLSAARVGHRVCGKTICSVFLNGSCRVPKPRFCTDMHALCDTDYLVHMPHRCASPTNDVRARQQG